MNLSWLEDFLALADSGNFSRAAEERHMTQPAFSRRVRALEEWLGTELFDRSSQPARLTAAGEWFRDTAPDLLDRVARVPGRAQAVAETHSSELRFAATHALSFTFVPGWLRGLETRAALGPVRLVSDVLQRCEAMLLQGQVDFVLSHAHTQALGELHARDCPSLHVGNDVLIPVSVAGEDGTPLHSLSQAAAKTPVRVLSYSAESGLGRILQAVRGSALARSPVQSVFTAHLASVLRTMALDGRGIAWLPRTLIAHDMEIGRLVEAADKDWLIDMEVRLYRTGSALGRASEVFWAAVCPDA